MLNKKALFLAISLTLIEILIFLGLSGSFYPKNITSERVLPYIPNMFIAIATTWYVIFTYFILKSNEIIRKLSTEPYLRINWDLSDHVEEKTLENFSILTEKFSESLDFKPRYIQKEKRYVCLLIQNIHQTKVGKLALKIIINVKFGTVENWFNEVFNYQSEDLNLGQDETTKITVLDLKAIPKSAFISFELKDIQYNPIDSRIILFDRSGIESYECYGVTELEEVPPKPQIDKEEKENE